MAISRKLPCLLNDEDILDRGRQLANAEFSYQQVDRERKAVTADFKNQLGAIDARIAELTNAIRDRVEERDVHLGQELPLTIGRAEGDNSKANASLIAAAPELLDALKLLLTSAIPNPKEHPTMTAAWAVGFAAVAKAEGRDDFK